MSNIYITEPKTSGKVLLRTSSGDVDIELWSKEAPLACRNFIQLALEGYYDETLFHRVVPGFMIQGGDPSGTGEGGESIYGNPFRDEIHQRIRFNHRGQVAMANSNEPNSNRSQFFITLDACEWLKGKHTIFGKVTGDTIFNVLRMGEALTGPDDRPLDPIVLLGIEVLWNPFDDITPRTVSKHREAPEDSALVEQRERKKSRKAKKDLKLLSFGDEAGEEDQAALTVGAKMASSHDKLDDSRLSKETAYDASSFPASTDPEEKERQRQQAERKKLIAAVRGAQATLKDATKDSKKGGESNEKTHQIEHEAENIPSIELDAENELVEQEEDHQQKTSTAEKVKKSILNKSSSNEGAETFEAKMRRQALERKEKIENKKTKDSEISGEDSDDVFDLSKFEDEEKKKKIKEKSREAAALRQELKASHRAVTVITGVERQKLDAESAFREMLSPLEQRRQKYLKRKRDHGSRQDETLLKLQSFTSTIRAAKSKSKEDQKPAQEEKQTESYHGQVLETDDVEDNVGNDRDWFLGKLKFKKHIDDKFRGGDGRNLDDYVVIDPLAKNKVK